MCRSIENYLDWNDKRNSPSVSNLPMKITSYINYQLVYVYLQSFLQGMCRSIENHLDSND